MSLPIALMAMTEFAPALHQGLINDDGAVVRLVAVLAGDAGRAVVSEHFSIKLGWQSIIHRAPNMFTLIAHRRRSRPMASVCSALLFPQTLPAAFTMNERCTAVLRSGGDHYDLGDPRTVFS